MTELADYALLADCHGAALVARDGSIDWCCMPRFDTGAVFARLLDPDAGTCTVEVDGGHAGDRRYLDGTFVLETRLHADEGEARLLDLMPLADPLSPAPDHRGLLRIVEGVRGTVRVRIRATPRFDEGEIAPWFRDRGRGLITATSGDDGLLCVGPTDLRLDGDTIVAEATLRPGERLRVLLATRRPAELDEVEDEPPPSEALDAALEDTIDGWREWELATRHPELAAAGVHRSALVLKALTYAPTGAMVAAPTTSLPEAVAGDERRTWDYRYAWIRDAVLATRCLTELGHDEEAKAFRRFVDRSGAGAAGDVRVFYGVGGERRLPERTLSHLRGFDGAQPVRSGNDAGPQLQLDSYGHLLEQSWTWAQLGRPPDDDQWRFLRGLVDAAAERWDVPDAGIWEWRGEPRHFVHSKLMCWVALDRGLLLAEQSMRRAPARHWRAARDAVREAVLAEGFDARRGTFVQAFGADDLDASVLRMPSYGFLAYEDERMLGTVAAVRAALEVAPGRLRRYDADDGMPPEGAFVACSFWLAECLAGQGRLDEAQAVYDGACATATDLGLLAEQVDPASGRLLGNFPLALTHLSHIHAALALEAAR
ncbi:GH15 family glucan-1,4-alpha-glucosidase [Solirubrobacter pauli]|uniref:GH15 family glucan-1,4-alpha-glucosidase n=1 Tax=Solirubrobacter pauli TaxID=166793 RepID=A0A660L1I0_9ACTN|nr:glycoside hydrolase family 15 protein [Solirubrobacter pauli]RKQ87064.1 GH15 family glucan-1,4-alpha-glucosidase [Solirubrobacter pauli]